MEGETVCGWKVYLSLFEFNKIHARWFLEKLDVKTILFFNLKQDKTTQ